MIAGFQLCHAVLAWLSFAVGAAAAFVLGYRRWHKRFLPVAAVSVLFLFAGLEGGWAWWDKAGRQIQSVLSASLVQDASAAAPSPRAQFSQDPGNGSVAYIDGGGLPPCGPAQNGVIYFSPNGHAYECLGYVGVWAMLW